jgi:hypothetical protein
LPGKRCAPLRKNFEPHCSACRSCEKQFFQPLWCDERLINVDQAHRRIDSFSVTFCLFDEEDYAAILE